MRGKYPYTHWLTDWPKERESERKHGRLYILWYSNESNFLMKMNSFGRRCGWLVGVLCLDSCTVRFLLLLLLLSWLMIEDYMRKLLFRTKVIIIIILVGAVRIQVERTRFLSARKLIYSCILCVNFFLFSKML